MDVDILGNIGVEKRFSKREPHCVFCILKARFQVGQRINFRGKWKHEFQNILQGYIQGYLHSSSKNFS